MSKTKEMDFELEKQKKQENISETEEIVELEDEEQSVKEYVPRHASGPVEPSTREKVIDYIKSLKNKEREHSHEHTHEHSHGHSDEDEEDNSTRLKKLIIGAVIYIPAFILYKFTELPIYITLALFIVAYLILGLDVVIHAVRNIAHGKVFDENFLMALSTIGAFAIGEYPEAVAVMLFYQIGELFQDSAVEKSRKSITELMDIRPDVAHVKRDMLVDLNPEEVQVGETIIVRPGEKIPLDGKVRDGVSMIDTKALTGESVPRSVGVGDEVLSGCINQNGVIEVKVTKPYSESTVSKIIDLVENATEKKAPAEHFITKFAHYYTPVVVAGAVLLAVIPSIITHDVSTWIYRAFVFLVISCPCALVISIPLTFFGGLGAASRKGVLIKGSNYLEALNNLDTVVFDKTGTLTKGTFAVTDIKTANGFTEDQLLILAASVESFSTHPIAKSLMSELSFRKGNIIDQSKIRDYTEVPGLGVTAVASNHLILVGNSKFMRTAKISFTESSAAGTKVYVAADGEFVGCAVISDEVKADSAAAISGLKKLGVRRTIMLTGDNEEIASSVAKRIGLDRYFADLLPDAKVQKLEAIMKAKSTVGNVAFVGDGINDAPVLARADIGVAMGGIGSDAAIEAADVVLMTDEPSRIIDAVSVAKETRKIVVQNVAFSLLVKLVLLILGALGIAGMWLAIFGDVGVMVLAVLNATRILRK